MCSGRVDLEFIHRAFANGMDGVFIVGCRLNECNYITHGNYDAFGMVHIFRKLLMHIGVNPLRLRIEFMSGGEGILFAEVMNDFGKKVEELGPLGESEGIDGNILTFNLEAIKTLIPYIKLVERERLRVPVKSEVEYNKFFASDEVNRVFNELIIDKLAISRIMQLLYEKPRATGEIAEMLNLNPSEVSRHIKDSTRQGLVRYDEGQKRFALA